MHLHATFRLSKPTTPTLQVKRFLWRILNHVSPYLPISPPPPGAVELLASDVVVLNTVSKPLPFPISTSEEAQEAREEVRLKHRVLDLR